MHNSKYTESGSYVHRIKVGFKSLKMVWIANWFCDFVAISENTTLKSIQWMGVIFAHKMESTGGLVPLHWWLGPPYRTIQNRSKLYLH